MDKVLEVVRGNGIAFQLGTEEVFRKLYEPFYGGQPDNVRVVKDIRYGHEERNYLDVYFPLEEAAKLRPVLIYVHGGGFFSGDKGWSDKVYGNIGTYFAQRGIVVIIGNHRLVPAAHYPDGGEDIQKTREWVYNHIGETQYGCGDSTKVVLFGHSSGGAHIASNLYSAGDPDLPTRDPLFPPVAGVAYFSVPWWYDMNKPMRKQIITQYYGSSDERVWEPLSPLGLFKRIDSGSPLLDSQKLPVLLGTVTWETEEATDGMLRFFNSYRERSQPTGSLPQLQVLPDHNHLSNILSIGTQDTRQAEALLEFIQFCTKI